MSDDDGRARVHYSEAPEGFEAWSHGVRFRLVGAQATITRDGYGCREAGCGRDGKRCAETDPQSSHSVVARVGAAVTEPGPLLRGFVNAIGDPWHFQRRGDLAWFEEREAGSGEFYAP